MSQLTVPSSLRTSSTSSVRKPRAARPSRGARPAPRVAVRGGATSVSVTRTERGSRGFMMLVAAIGLLSCLALLMLNTWRAEQSFTLTKLQSDVSTLQDQKQALESDVSAMSNTQALALKAESLGLHPAAHKYVDASSHKVLGVATPGNVGGDISVNTLSDSPASQAASDVVNTDTVGVHVQDPVAKAAADAKAKAAAQQKAEAAKQAPSKKK